MAAFVAIALSACDKDAEVYDLLPDDETETRITETTTATTATERITAKTMMSGAVFLSRLLPESPLADDTPSFPRKKVLTITSICSLTERQ